jgi:hypothetical protein
VLGVGALTTAATQEKTIPQTTITVISFPIFMVAPASLCARVQVIRQWLRKPYGLIGCRSGGRIEDLGPGDFVRVECVGTPTFLSTVKQV